MILDPQWRPTVVVMDMVRPEESVAVMLDVPLSNSGPTLYAKSKLSLLTGLGKYRNNAYFGGL